MIINSFKMRTGKPMIDSLESAKELLTQCKVAFDLKLQDRKTFLTFFGGDDYIPCKVGKYEKVDEWTDVEVAVWYGDEAIKKCYEYRKHVNEFFNDLSGALNKNKRARRERKDKWVVYGECGGSFTNLKDACKCAKEFSLCEDYKDEEISVWLIDEGSYYISYKNGKKVFDGWSANKEKKRNETK